MRLLEIKRKRKKKQKENPYKNFSSTGIFIKDLTKIPGNRATSFHSYTDSTPNFIPWLAAII